jgi:hypothetical protein
MQKSLEYLSQRIGLTVSVECLLPGPPNRTPPKSVSRNGTVTHGHLQTRLGLLNARSEWLGWQCDEACDVKAGVGDCMEIKCRLCSRMAYWIPKAVTCSVLCL